MNATNPTHRNSGKVIEVAEGDTVVITRRLRELARLVCDLSQAGK